MKKIAYTILVGGIASIMLASCSEQAVQPTDNSLAISKITESLEVGDDLSQSSFGAGNWQLVSTPDGAGFVDGQYEIRKAGKYEIAQFNESGEVVASHSFVLIAPTFSTVDQMGRPGINTVFNYFNTAGKESYNYQLPSTGAATNTDYFASTLNTLQAYIGLVPADFRNILGLDNTTTASVLAADALSCNLSMPTSYGALNGRGLADDVINVTLTLTFQDTNGDPNNAFIPGLVNDNVDANDKAFMTTFPYLAMPH